jgi:hypothetical protein
MAQLLPQERQTLAALLARLKSPFDNERLAAATLATQFVEKHNTTWIEVLTPAPPPPVVIQTQAPTQTGPRYWRHCAEEALFDHSQALSEWEAQFLQDVLRRGYTPSAKQEAVLRRIANKTGVPAW